jgi:hypothetical protein
MTGNLFSLKRKNVTVHQGAKKPGFFAKEPLYPLKSTLDEACFAQ